MPATLADRAWQLGEGGKRVIAYCQRRAAAQQVRDSIDEARRDGLAGVTELVVEARRVLVPIAEPDDGDPFFGRARLWVSRTPYRPTRHPRRPADAVDLLRRDVSLECQRRGLPRPEVELIEVATGRRGGIATRLRLEFSVAVPGPLLLGAGSHFGNGLFTAQA